MVVKQFVRKTRALAKLAAGYAVYSRPSRRWIGFREYFMSGDRYDLVKLHPAGFKFPVYMRRGTTDLDNYDQIFSRKEYDFLPLRPLTILDLGGYIGLASIWLANRYPDCQIVLVEPDPDNYAIALLNCRGYANIKCLNYGVWSKSCKITLAKQVGGDWANMFEEVLGAGDQFNDPSCIEAKSLVDIMSLNGFDSIDFLKIDIEGAEKILFEAPNVLDWLLKCRVVSCELHDRMLPGCSEAVYKAVSKAGFSSAKHCEFDYFIKDLS